MLDRFDCYELCVQSPRHVTALLAAIHDNQPRVLQEDFCGTAAVSRRWVIEGEDRVAHAIDLDGEVVAKARALVEAMPALAQRRLEIMQGDCITAGASPDATRRGAEQVTSPASSLRGGVIHAPDVIFVGNFSIGYIAERGALVAYLRACKRRLDAGNGGFGGGVFCCDLYGGASAFRLGAIERRHPSRGREIIRYVWRHEAADPRTARVVNSISFRVEVDGEIVQELPRAFVYEWRLWSLSELTDAMREAGFADVQVYKDLNIAPGQPAIAVQSAEELPEDWVVLVAAR